MSRNRSLADAIVRNRRMVAYRESCQRIRKYILLRMWEYVDQGKTDQAVRVIQGLSKRIVEMSEDRRWKDDATDRRIERERLANCQ